MKKLKLKKSVIQKVKDFTEITIASMGIAVLLFAGLSCISWSVKQYDHRMIQEEYNKKTDTVGTYISQKN